MHIPDSRTIQFNFIIPYFYNYNVNGIFFIRLVSRNFVAYCVIAFDIVREVDTMPNRVWFSVPLFIEALTPSKFRWVYKFPRSINLEHGSIKRRRKNSSISFQRKQRSICLLGCDESMMKYTINSLNSI